MNRSVVIQKLETKAKRKIVISDIHGNLDLYLKLLRDFNPYLLAIPCHDGHPLLYLMHVNFKKLQPFFSKAILVEDAGKPMSMFLLNAYLHNLPRGYSLLKNLISINPMARQELAWYVCCLLYTSPSPRDCS